MHVYHIGDYRVMKLESDLVQDDGEWVIADRYVVLDAAEVSPLIEVSIPRKGDEMDDAEVVKLFQTLLGWVRQIEASEPDLPESFEHPPEKPLRLVRDEPETDPGQDG